MEEKKECERCGDPLSTHKKCKVCSILLHPEHEKFNCRCGIQHGKECEFNDDFCESCFFNKYNK